MPLAASGCEPALAEQAVERRVGDYLVVLTVGL
jgi:hypothetical protein